MENEQTVYYYYGLPRAVRIISKSVGIDKTLGLETELVPDRNGRKETETEFYSHLISLAANSEIDHVFVLERPFIEDENENLVYSGIPTLDLCDPKVCLKSWKVWDEKRMQKFDAAYEAAAKERREFFRQHPEAYDPQEDSDFIAGWLAHIPHSEPSISAVDLIIPPLSPDLSSTES